MNRRFVRGLAPNSGVGSTGYTSGVAADIPGLERTAPTLPTITPGVTIANPDAAPAQIPGSMEQSSRASGISQGTAVLNVPTPPVPQP
jgi:hypothetical protein